MKKTYRISTVLNGDRMDDAEDFQDAKKAVGHIISLEKRAVVNKILDKLEKKIDQAERKSKDDLRYWSAVKDGLEEAKAIIEKEWK